MILKVFPAVLLRPIAVPIKDYTYVYKQSISGHFSHSQCIASAFGDKTERGNTQYLIDTSATCIFRHRPCRKIEKQEITRRPTVRVEQVNVRQREKNQLQRDRILLRSNALHFGPRREHIAVDELHRTYLHTQTSFW